MYERLFSTLPVQQRHAARPQAPLLERATYDLLDHGFCVSTVNKHLCSWEDFIEWLPLRGVPLEHADESLVKAFIQDQSQGRAWHGKAVGPDQVAKWHRPALGRLLAFLRAEGLIAPKTPALPPPFWGESLLDRFAAFLHSHRGLQPSQVTSARREARMYLHSLRVFAWEEGRQAMNPASIDAFLRERSTGLARKSRNSVASRLRGFFRFLHLTGELSVNLAPQVPGVREYQLASLPLSIGREEVDHVLATVDRATKYGRRDYAILLLLARYGLRAGEITQLCLEDIDWRAEVLRITHTKTGRESRYPLLPEVAEALIDYLRQGRPRSTHREVFLTAHAPHTPFSRGCALYSCVSAAFKRAGITPPCRGPHTFRHATAIRLLEDGHPLKTIGDVLGHRDPQSTAIYTKVDLKALREVALEVEVLP